MLELGIGADIVRAVGWLYIAVVAFFVGISLWFPPGWWRKAIAVTASLVVFVGPVYLVGRERDKVVQARKARYAAATALFQARCKSAGSQIYKTVNDVEGILLLNVRAPRKASDLENKNWPNAGLPSEAAEDEYVANFLKWEHRTDKRMPRGYLNHSPSDLPGYRYVDVKGEGDVIYRYSFANRGQPDLTKLSRSTIESSPSRYAVSFTNVVDAEGRDLWIAGTTVTIVDIQSNEVLAKNTWYSMDPGQGSTVGFRAPWAAARTCPEPQGWDGAPTRMFVDQVLKPKMGE